MLMELFENLCSFGPHNYKTNGERSASIGVTVKLCLKDKIGKIGH